MKKFEILDCLNQVGEFHSSFDHPILEAPAIPDQKRIALRISLLQEELNELKEAIESNDLVAVADAFCDLQYVLSGAILEFGFAEKFKSLFDEVHRSNMSKACSTEEEAERTADSHFKKNQEECFHVLRKGKFLVYRKSDNKTIKSLAYSPANLSSLLKS